MNAKLIIASLLIMSKVSWSVPETYQLQPQVNFTIGEIAANALINDAFKGEYTAGLGSNVVKFRFRKAQLKFYPGSIGITIDAVVKYDFVTPSTKTVRLLINKSIPSNGFQLSYSQTKKKVVLVLSDVIAHIQGVVPQYVKDEVQGIFNEFAIYPVDLISDIGKPMENGLLKIAESFPIRYLNDFNVAATLGSGNITVSISPKFEMQTVDIQIRRVGGYAGMPNFGQWNIYTNIPLEISNIKISDLSGVTKTWSQTYVITGTTLNSNGFRSFFKRFDLTNNSNGMTGPNYIFQANVTNGLTNLHVKGQYSTAINNQWVSLSWK